MKLALLIALLKALQDEYGPDVKVMTEVMKTDSLGDNSYLCGVINGLQISEDKQWVALTGEN